MGYISYKNLPIWFGTGVNDNNIPDESASYKEIFAQSIQLNYSPPLQPVRILGKTPTANNYNLAGPPNTTLSFSCYLDPTVATTSTTSFNPLAYTGNIGNVGTTFLIGNATNGIKGSGAFLTSLSFTSTPYQPILFQCEFAVYNPLAISSDGGSIASTTAGSFDLNKAAHGAYSNFVSADLPTIDLYDSFTYQYSCQRLPIYEIGGFYPQSVEFMTAEHSFSLEADNIPNIAPLYGSNATVDIYVSSPAGGSNSLPPSATYDLDNPLDYTHASAIKPRVAGKILQQNVGIQGGDFGRGSTVITQLLR